MVCILCGKYAIPCSIYTTSQIYCLPVVLETEVSNIRYQAAAETHPFHGKSLLLLTSTVALGTTLSEFLYYFF